MKVRLFGLAILCTLAVVVAISNSPAIHSQGKPKPNPNGLSKAEWEFLSEINSARAHPDVYISYLEQLKPLFKGKVYRGTLETQEGWAAVEDAIAYLRALKPESPFGFSSGLQLAAKAHVKDQSRSGATGHQTQGSGAMIEDRVKPFGSWDGAIGENLSYGNDSARERVLTWLIDDGVASRGHRKRVMSSDYRVAGLSCGKHTEYGTMCCLTLAGAFTDSETTANANKDSNSNKTNKTKAAPAKARKF